MFTSKLGGDEVKMNLTSKSFEMVFVGSKSSSTKIAKIDRYKTARNVGCFLLRTLIFN